MRCARKLVLLPRFRIPNKSVVKDRTNESTQGRKKKTYTGDANYLSLRYTSENTQYRKKQACDGGEFDA